jgi:hypothetical protein
MSNLFHDLLHDLRAKRLLPVAILLLVAIVAIPVVLIKPAEEPPPAPAPAAAASVKEATMPELKDLAVVTDAAERGGSTLDQFESADPFRPPEELTKTETLADSTAAAASGAKASSSGIAAAGAPGKGNAGGNGGGGGQVQPLAPRAPTPPTVKTAYNYVVDLTYARNGHLRTVRGMNRLGMLPNEDSPLLIFLGVSANGDDAVFLVDSALSATGEGKCTPSASQCATLTIGAGEEHEFTDAEGNAYGLRIDEIRRVKVGAGASAKASRRSRRPKARAAVTRRFQPPVLADLLTVEGPASSNRHTSR